MKQRRSLLPALILILLGVYFLLDNLGLLTGVRLPSLAELWPGIILLAGLAFLFQYASGADRDPGLIFVGVSTTLLGAFFLLFTLKGTRLPFRQVGRVDWGDMEVLWPAFILIAGIAFLAQYVLGGLRDRSALQAGFWSVLVGLIAFVFTLGLAASLAPLLRFWPLLLILAGLSWLLRRGKG